MDYQRRLKGLQERMDEKGLDLVVMGGSPDFQYLTGTMVQWRKHRDLTHPADSVFVPREGDPVLLLGRGSSRHAEETWIEDVRTLEMFEDFRPHVKEIIGDLVDEPGKVGVGEYTWGSMVLEVARYCKGAKFRSAEDILDDLRMIKEPEEIERLRKAAELTDGVMAEIVGEIEEGVTQKAISLSIETLGRLSGASDVSFPTTAGFTKSGSEPTESPFNYEEDEGLERETSIAFDIGFVLDGYCSDWGRSVYFGPADDNIARAYEVLMSAVVETMDAIGEDVHRINELYPSIEAVCDREHYGDYLRARLTTGLVGHQIGVEVHEDPWLKLSDGRELQDGMVFCLEPKLWHNGEYYLRVEDMVLIKNGRAEALTTYDREQFQL